MKKKFVLSLLAGMMILSSFGTGVFASETAAYGEVTIENGDRTLTFTEMPWIGYNKLDRFFKVI